MNPQISSLLDQFSKHNGRGNMIAANETMVEIVKVLAVMAQPCQCNCGGKPLIQPQLDRIMPATPVIEPVGEEPPIKRKVGRPRKHF